MFIDTVPYKRVRACSEIYTWTNGLPGKDTYSFIYIRTCKDKQHSTAHLERDDGGCCPCSLCVFNHSGSPALHDGHAGIRGPQVDPDDVAGRTLRRQRSALHSRSCA